jgi:3',5'-cyclic AMP phosphodiesterase CpdA
MPLRAAWLTDVHLNFVAMDQVARFAETVRRADVDAVLVGGDIGESLSFSGYLEEFAVRIRKPIYFVLGNHDFYRGAIDGVRNEARELGRRGYGIAWLPDSEIVELSPATVLIGHDGWADGRAGDFLKSEIMLNDYWLIEDLVQLRRTGPDAPVDVAFDAPASKQRLFAKLQQLGDESAAHFARVLPEAALRGRLIVVLMHVPPFREACWYQGKPSGDDWVPHLACVAAGNVLREFMRQHPDRQMLVLCGHTHGGGEAQILDNLVVMAGTAAYGNPVIQRVFEWE